MPTVVQFSFSLLFELPYPLFTFRQQNTLEYIHSMRFLNSSSPFLLTIVLLLSLLPSSSIAYELTITNNATFPIDPSTFYFNNRLIYENSSFFYLVQIQDNIANSILQIDQSHNNNVSSLGNLLIDNFHRNTFFLAVNMQNYLGFVYDLQSESGFIGTLLIVNKANFSENYMTSLYSSYVAVEYLQNQGALVSISSYNEANLIINAENSNVSIVSGPILANAWATFNDTILIKSSGESYMLVFSLQNMVFQLLQIGVETISIISQNNVNVSSVCFIQESQVVVHQNDTLSFYSLPGLTLIQTTATNQTQSSYCYYDDITNALIFVYGQSSDSIFWAYSLNTSSQVNTTIVSGYTEIYLQNSNLYLVDTENANQVSYTFFDYQSCHHSYLYDPATYICYQCPSSCQTCTSTQFCYDCRAGNYFIDDFCCGNSQYYEIVSTVKSCHNCAVGCYNCTNATNCHICRANNYFIDNYCCGNSQYYLVSGSTKSCLNCPTGCYNCSSSQFCYTCKANNVFYDDYCCGVSQYYNIVNSTKGCLACPSTCYNCSSSLNCYSCKANNKFIDNYCCGVRQYYISANGAKSCFACPTGCYNCSSASVCYTCSANYVKVDNFCCLSNQYLTTVNGAASCQACATGCYNCSSASVCLTCSANYVKVDNFCCLSNQYLTTVNGAASCQACATGCSNCSSATHCNQCNSTWYLGMNNVCYNSTESMLAGEYAGMEGGSTSAMSAMTGNEFISFFNSIPSMRGIFQAIFGSFVWFDELYPFQFHLRNYGYRMNMTFKAGQSIQTNKWQGLNWMVTDQILTLFGSSMKKISNGLDYKKNHTTSHFKSYQPSGEGLFPNGLSFILTVTLVTLFIFLLLRGVFFLTFHHRWSLYFRSFSFWPYLIVILMEGNLLQLIFFACGDLKLSFSLGFPEKVSNVFSWTFFYLFTVIASALFPMLLSSYQQKAKYFCYNIKFKNIAIIYLAIQLGFRNLFQAMVHYFLKENPYYRLQFVLLILCEIILCINSFYFISQNIFNYKLKVWLSILQSFTKTVLIFFLFLRMEFLDITSVNYQTDSVLGYVVAFYVVLIYISMGVSLTIILREFIESVYRTINRDQKERLKGITDNKEEMVKKAKQEQLEQAQARYNQFKPQVTLKKQRNMFFLAEKKQTNIDIPQKKIVRIKR